jgi:hypothetical protein
MEMAAEHERLREVRECGTPWRKWGPYLRERQWGIAREYQNAQDAALRDLSCEQACSWAYEWGEDGLAGICDEQMRLCFAIALWNGRDRFLKERLGAPEDGANTASKDRCIYLDNVPTHSYMRVLYKYSDYFDVFVEYAKASPEEILVRITIDNRGQEQADVHVLPHLWFRNTWRGDSRSEQPIIERLVSPSSSEFLAARHTTAGIHYLQYEAAAEVLFTNNETNTMRWHDGPNAVRCVKDGVRDYIVNGIEAAVDRAARGTKAAVHYAFVLLPDGSRTIRLKLSTSTPSKCSLSSLPFDKTIQQRRREAEEFYAALTRDQCDARLSRTFRRAFAASLWSKQTYLYDISGWLDDRREEAHAQASKRTRFHVTSSIVLAMPDKWHRPRFGASSAILHALALARVDPDLACDQLESLLSADLVVAAENLLDGSEAYDPSFHAWSALLMYRLLRPRLAQRAFIFLRHAFSLLRVREASAAWAGLHVQSMFEIAVELALMDAQYEQAAIELYLRFVSFIGSADVRGEETVSHMTSNVENSSTELVPPVHLISVCAAAMLPDTTYRRLPRLLEYVYALTCENAGPFRHFKPLKAGSINGRRILSIVDECTLRVLFARLVESESHAAQHNRRLCGVPSGVVLLRALLCLHDCYGDALRVSLPFGSRQVKTLLELSREIARRMGLSLLERSHGTTQTEQMRRSASQPAWHDLIRFYEFVYSESHDGLRCTGWAGFIAPLLCLMSGYRPFERTAPYPRPEMRIAYQRYGNHASESVHSGPNRSGCSGSRDHCVEVSADLS